MGGRARASLLVLIFALSSIAPLSSSQSSELTLRLGTMLPLTGALSALGPDMQMAVQLAVADANAAGAGIRVIQIDADDKTTDTLDAVSTYDGLLSQGVTAIVGPCCSGVTSAILPSAIEDGVLIVTPSATRPDLTEGRDNRGLFYRISSTATLEARALAGLVAREHGAGSYVVAIQGLDEAARSFGAEIERLGVAYNPGLRHPEGQTTFANEAAMLCADTSISAIVIFGYADSTSALVKALGQAGCRARLTFYADSGSYSTNVADLAGRNSDGQLFASGLRGTVDPLPTSSVFAQRFQSRFGHAPSQYAVEAFDAANLIILSAMRARSADGTSMAANLLHVSNAPGLLVDDVRTGAAALRRGEAIDFRGEALDGDIGSDGDVLSQTYVVWEVDASGALINDGEASAARPAPSLGPDLLPPVTTQAAGPSQSAPVDPTPSLTSPGVSTPPSPTTFTGTTEMPAGDGASSAWPFMLGIGVVAIAGASFLALRRKGMRADANRPPRASPVATPRPPAAPPEDASRGQARLAKLAAGVAASRAELDAMRARHANLRDVAEIDDLLVRAARDSGGELLRDAASAIARIAKGLAQRQALLDEAKELASNQRLLARRVSKGEIDGRTFETLNTTLEQERGELEARLRVLDDQLFQDDFEKPV